MTKNKSNKQNNDKALVLHKGGGAPQQPKGGQPNKAPAAVSINYTKQKPKVVGTPGGMRVRHTEFVMDILPVATPFVLQVVEPINPGLAQLFPWLSNIARNFETYKVHKMRFYRLPVAPTTAAGSVMLALEYDALDTPPSSKVTLMQNSSIQRSSVWAPSAISVSTKDAHQMVKQLFIRSRPIPTADMKTYDCGLIMVGLNTPAAENPGELYVEYDIEFFTPSPRAPDEGAQVLSLLPTNPTPLASGTTTNSEIVSVSPTGVAINEVGDYILSVYTTGTNPQLSFTGNSVTVASGVVQTDRCAYTLLTSVLSPGAFIQFLGIGAVLSTVTVRLARYSKSNNV